MLLAHSWVKACGCDCANSFVLPSTLMVEYTGQLGAFARAYWTIMKFPNIVKGEKYKNKKNVIIN